MEKDVKKYLADRNKLDLLEQKKKITYEEAKEQLVNGDFEREEDYKQGLLERVFVIVADNKCKVYLTIKTAIDFNSFQDIKKAKDEVESMELQELFEKIDFQILDKKELAKLTSIKVDAIQKL